MKRSVYLGLIFAVALAVPLVGGGPSIASSASREPSAVEATGTGTFVNRDTVDVTTAAPTATVSRDVAVVSRKSTSSQSASSSSSTSSAAGSDPSGTAPRVVVTRDASHSSAHKPTVPTPTPGGGDRDNPPAPQQGNGCAANITGDTRTAPSKVSDDGVQGTTTQDLADFATATNEIRVAHCLDPIPLANFKYDSCMEQRLFWMAEDPSTNPASAWGHIGSKRSDGVASVGCDGNLAGGSNNTAATVAQKWWDSSDHRASLYRPTYSGSFGGVCIIFAITHGGVPNESYSFARAAARWVTC